MRFISIFHRLSGIFFKCNYGNVTRKIWFYAHSPHHWEILATPLRGTIILLVLLFESEFEYFRVDVVHFFTSFVKIAYTQPLINTARTSFRRFFPLNSWPSWLFVICQKRILFCIRTFEFSIIMCVNVLCSENSIISGESIYEIKNREPWLLKLTDMSVENLNVFKRFFFIDVRGFSPKISISKTTK